MAQYDELFGIPQKFNETDYRQALDYPGRINENDMWKKCTIKETEEREMERREHERRMETVREMQERLTEMYRAQPVQGLFDGNASFGAKSKKEATVGRFALKYCFFMSRMVMIANGATGYSDELSKKLSAASNWFSKDSVRNKIYRSILDEGSKNGISQSEIDDAIRSVNSKFGSREMGESFVAHFVGVLALRAFKNNPRIIKDTGKVKGGGVGKKTHLGEYEFTGIDELIRRINEFNVPLINVRPTTSRPFVQYESWIQRALAQEIETPQYQIYAGPFEDEDDKGEAQSRSFKDYMKRLFKA